MTNLEGDVRVATVRGAEDDEIAKDAKDDELQDDETVRERSVRTERSWRALGTARRWSWSERRDAGLERTARCGAGANGAMQTARCGRRGAD